MTLRRYSVWAEDARTGSTVAVQYHWTRRGMRRAVRRLNAARGARYASVRFYGQEQP
jgi:hypothetical protein